MTELLLALADIERKATNALIRFDAKDQPEEDRLALKAVAERLHTLARRIRLYGADPVTWKETP